VSPSTDRASIVSRPEPLAFDVVRDLARRHLTGVVAAGKPGRVNRRLVRALGEHGLLARVFPSAGAASARGTVSAADLCLLREALAMECPEAETALALQGLGAYPILQSGSAELAGRWIPAVRQGDAVAAFALTEPGAGSDAARLALSADAAPGGFYLSGEKCWISNAPDADVYTVFARTTPGAGARGITAFVVPGDAPGLSGQPLEMLAPHPIGRLTFDGVFVPRSAVLGEPDRGFKVAMRTLDLFRPSVGAFAVGLARSALDEAVRHTRARPAYGATLADLQAVAHKLADMAVAVRAAHLLVRDAAAAYDAGAGDLTVRASMAKLFATEVAQRVVDDAVQLHGAAALERGHPLEHLYRDVRAPRIYEGASEVQRDIIARSLLGHQRR